MDIFKLLPAFIKTKDTLRGKSISKYNASEEIRKEFVLSVHDYESVLVKAIDAYSVNGFTVIPMPNNESERQRTGRFFDWSSVCITKNLSNRETGKTDFCIGHFSMAEFIAQYLITGGFKKLGTEPILDTASLIDEFSEAQDFLNLLLRDITNDQRGVGNDY